MRISRRSFLGCAGAATAAGTMPAAPSPSGVQAHPLAGVRRENLKVTDIKVTLLSCELPKDKQWVTGKAVTWKSDAVLVEVFTDKGIVGIGESTPYGDPPLVKQFIESEIKPRLTGANPFDVEHLACGWGDSASHTPGRRNDAWRSQISWAGVDGALWDIIGKARGVPVYKLLAAGGEAAPRIRMYASGGVEYAWYKRPDDLIDEA